MPCKDTWYKVVFLPAGLRLFRSLTRPQDNCLTSVIFEHIVGMSCVSLNACWVANFMFLLYNPLRNTRSLM